jgi:hypothetical protein
MVARRSVYGVHKARDVAEEGREVFAPKHPYGRVLGRKGGCGMASPDEQCTAPECAMRPDQLGSARQVGRVDQ